MSTDLNGGADSIAKHAAMAKQFVGRNDLLECYREAMACLEESHQLAISVREELLKRMKDVGFVSPDEVPEIPLMRVIAGP